MLPINNAFFSSVEVGIINENFLFASCAMVITPPPPHTHIKNHVYVHVVSNYYHYYGWG